VYLSFEEFVNWYKLIRGKSFTEKTLKKIDDTGRRSNSISFKIDFLDSKKKKKKKKKKKI